MHMLRKLVIFHDFAARKAPKSGFLRSNQRGIGNRRASHSGKGRELVRRRGGGREDVAHVDPSGRQGIGNQLAVALPPLRLGAHHCRASIPAEREQRVEVPRKCRRLHVVGVPAKALVLPAAVRRVATRLAETAKTRQVDVGDAMVRQERGERLG